MVAGLGLSKPMSMLAGWPVEMGISSIGRAFNFAAPIGIFFGFYPVRHGLDAPPNQPLGYESSGPWPIIGHLP